MELKLVGFEGILDILWTLDIRFLESTDGQRAFLYPLFRGCFLLDVTCVMTHIHLLHMQYLHQSHRRGDAARPFEAEHHMLQPSESGPSRAVGRGE